MNQIFDEELDHIMYQIFDEEINYIQHQIFEEDINRVKHQIFEGPYVVAVVDPFIGARCCLWLCLYMSDDRIGVACVFVLVLL